MTSAKIHTKPSRLKRHLIRFRQSVPSSSLLLVDKFLGGLLGSRALPYHIQAEITSPSYFILGSGRSGNTLLRRLLMEDFDTFIPPEMPGLGKGMRGLIQNRKRGWDTCVISFFENFEASANVAIKNPESGEIYNLWSELGLSTDELIRQALAISPASRSGAALISFLYDSILTAAEFPTTSHTVIGDKTPWNVMYTRQIETFFPNARFAYIVRHPLAVAYSYVKGLSAVNGITLDDAVRRWAIAQTNCLDLAGRVGHDRLFVTQYERLVTSENESRRVGAMLGLPKREGRDVPDSISEADAKLVQHKRINQRVDATSVDIWKSEIVGETRDRLLAIVQPAMTRLANEFGIYYHDNC